MKNDSQKSYNIPKQSNCDILLLDPTIVKLAESQFFAGMNEVMQIKEKRQNQNPNNGCFNSEMRVRVRNPRGS